MPKKLFGVNCRFVSKLNTTFILTAGVMLFLSSQSLASDDEFTLDEITVTVQRYEETLQEAPLSVTVISGDNIMASGINNFDDVLQSVPGLELTINPQPNKGPTIAIRGIGTDGQTKRPSVSLYLDGIDSFRMSNYFYDIARVEVLRGPQGTLYGGSATGGAVNVISNNPTSEFEAKGQLEAGNYGLWNTQAMVNVPASDDLNFRVAGNYLIRDQYANGGPKGLDVLNFRGKMLWTPSEAFSLLAGVEHYGDDGMPRDNMDVDINGKPEGARYIQTGDSYIDVNRYYLTLDVDLGFGRLTYIPAMQYVKASTTFTREMPIQTFNQDGNLMTHELRLASQPDSHYAWIVGAYYYNEDSLGTGRVQLPFGDINIRDDINNKGYAGFGQATIPLSEAWRLTAGGRYSKDPVDHTQTFAYPPILGIDSTPKPLIKKYSHFDYLARVEHDLTKINRLYATISTGYRPGGLAMAGSGFENEEVTAYEIGSKNTLLDGYMTLNAAAFYYDYSGFQVTNAATCGPGCIIEEVLTLPAKFMGVELETTFLLTQSDTITLAPTYLKGDYTTDTIARFDITKPSIIVPTKEKSVAHAPEWNINASYQHNFMLSNGSEMFLRGEGAYTASQITNFSAYAYLDDAVAATFSTTSRAIHYIQEAYTLVNMSAGYTSKGDRWGITGYVRNLTDKVYKISGGGMGGASVGAPRTYGLILSAKW